MPETVLIVGGRVSAVLPCFILVLLCFVGRERRVNSFMFAGLMFAFLRQNHVCED